MYRAKILREGAYLVVDLGNSTSQLLRRTALLADCRKLEATVANFFRPVHEHGGSVMSFTGDGFIALFDRERFPDERTTVQHALKACEDLRPTTTRKRRSVTVRAALHWGRCYVPSAGPLRDQIIGWDVVYTARLCDWLGRVIELAQPPDERDRSIGITADILRLMHIDEQAKWDTWGQPDFRGIGEGPAVYLRSIGRS